MDQRKFLKGQLRFSKISYTTHLFAKETKETKCLLFSNTGKRKEKFLELTSAPASVQSAIESLCQLQVAGIIMNICIWGSQVDLIVKNVEESGQANRIFRDT